MRARRSFRHASPAVALLLATAAVGLAPACVAVRTWDGAALGLAACDATQTQPGEACVPPHAKSCKALPASCGANESCCATILVPGGTFVRGYDPSGADKMVVNGTPTKVVGYQAGEPAAATATMLPFFLDKYEVSVGRFRAFLAEYDAWVVDQPKNDDGANEYWPSTGWHQGDWKSKLPTTAAELVARFDTSSGSTCGQTTWSATPAGDATENLPVSCVDWYEAFAFCIWDGGRLPTEAEWNYAAAGGAKQRAFPWSDPPGDLTIQDGFANVKLASEPDFALVGSLTGHDALWGHADLAGNVWEWVFDSATAPTLDGYYAQSPCTHCADFTWQAANDFRIMRGGSKRYFPFAARTAFRLAPKADQKYGDMGFRCARAKAQP